MRVSIFAITLRQTDLEQEHVWTMPRREQRRIVCTVNISWIFATWRVKWGRSTIVPFETRIAVNSFGVLVA